MNDERCQMQLETDEILNLANNHVQQAIGKAFDCLTQRIASTSAVLHTATMLSSTASFSNLSLQTPHRSLRPIVSIRCRSSSRHDQRERQVPFHHTIPRCSLPATKTDLVVYKGHSSSYQQAIQTRCRSSQNVNVHGSNRTFDVQYSFSLNQPWLTKIDQERHRLISVHHLANELVEHIIRTAFVHVRSFSSVFGTHVFIHFIFELSFDNNNN
jgi:hypothetical protein